MPYEFNDAVFMAFDAKCNGTEKALKRSDLDCVMALIRPWLWIQKQRMSIFQAY